MKPAGSGANKKLRNTPCCEEECYGTVYKKAILQTFREMLEKMPFDKITVSAIVANCEISSNTFYYHYRDIYDMLDTWLVVKKEKYIGNL